MNKLKNKTAPAPDPRIVDYLVEQQRSKYNDSITLSREDTDNKVRIMCKEPYAESLLKMYKEHGLVAGGHSKDLNKGQVYNVRPSVVNFDQKYLMCEEINSKAPMYVNLQDYPGDVNDLAAGKAETFGVMVVRAENGVYHGSNKKFREIDNVNVLRSLQESQTPFEVELKELVRGGYVATYDDTVKCFLPGSHAAANIVMDFDGMIGKKIPVVVDNYDRSSNMFIVSYKKYIEITMPTMIHELHFGRKYVGTLTSKPTKFGLFVELEGYYTGLIHKTEFENYDDVCKKYKVGDQIDVYIRNVNKKQGRWRIVLTLDDERIDRRKRSMQELRDDCLNKMLEYFYDEGSRRFYIIKSDGEMQNVYVKYDSIMGRMYKNDRVVITKVDVINETVSFDFRSSGEPD